MKKWTAFLLVSAIAFGATGCMPSAYTNIEQVGDKTYYVTATEAGFFKTSGVLYKCEAEGKKMVCTEVGED